jgi:type I restriction enzyme S subunit
MMGETLSDICEIVMGQSPSGESCNKEGIGIPLLNGPTEYGDHHPTPVQFTTSPRKHANEGDLLFCVRGSTTGRMNWADREYAIGRGIAAIRHNSNLELQPFVRAVVEYNLPNLLIQATGSTFPNVSAGQLSSLPWPNLDETEQRAIAHILGTLDDKIELNRKRNETLEAMAQALFKDWFVDFGPVRAKLEGRDPYLPAEIWDLFPDRLDEEGKPEGWGMKPLDEIADFLNGLALQKYPSLDSDDSLPVIKIAELRNGISAKSDRASRNVPSKYIIEDGDFLFSWSGSLMAKFWTEGEGALNQHLFKVTSDQYPLWFVSQWVYSHLSDFQAIAASKATTMGHIQRGHLKTAMTICPSSAEIEKLGRVLSPLVEQTIKNELESRNLTQLRDTLLPKLISGEVRVGDVDRFIDRALQGESV